MASSGAATPTGIAPTARCPHGIGLLFVDLDGTIMRAGHELSPRVVAAFSAAHERGVVLAVCTGRAIAMVPETVRGMGVIDYYVCSNGASVTDARLVGIRDAAMPAALAAGVVGALAPLRPAWNAFVDGHGFAELANVSYMLSDRRRIASYVGAVSRAPDSLARKLARLARTARRLLFGSGALRRVLDISPTLARASSVEKLGCSFASPQLADAAAELLVDAGFEVAAVAARELELTAPGVSKGTAAAWLAARLGIERERCVAIGDSANDASLWSAVGCLVAMDNADDALKALASCTCGGIDEDGVAVWLEAQMQEP